MRRKYNAKLVVIGFTLIFVMLTMSCKSKIASGKYVTTLKTSGETIDIILELTFEDSDSSGRFMVTRDTNPLNSNRTFLPDSIMLEDGEYVSFIVKPEFDENNMMTFYITNEDRPDRPDLLFILEKKGRNLEGIWKFDDTMLETPIAFKKAKR